jgi:hypothetical protein
MQYVCDAPGRKTWFRIESEDEAALESDVMRNMVEAQYRNERQVAAEAYKPAPRLRYIERDIALKAHLQRTMPIFLTLRDSEGTPLANAVLPPSGREQEQQSTVTGPGNADPFPAQGDAIRALEKHFGVAFHTQTFEYDQLLCWQAGV